MTEPVQTAPRPRGRPRGKTAQTLLKEVKEAEIKALAEQSVDSGMVIDGIRIDPLKYKAYQAWCKTGSVDKAIELLNSWGYSLSGRTLYDWKNQVWWKILHDRVFKEAQEIFQKELSDNASLIAKGLIRIASGEDKTDRTAMATVRAAEVFATVGREPLIQRSPHVQINNNQKFNTLITGEKLQEVLKQMAPGEMMEFTLTGKLPDKYNEQQMTVVTDLEPVANEPVPAGTDKSTEPVG